MSLVTEILIIQDDETKPEVTALNAFLGDLGYMWSSQSKIQSLAQLPACQLILFEAGRNPELDQKLMQDLRSQVAYLPIVILSDEAMNVSPALAKLGSSILHTPSTQDALKKKILRHLEPRQGHQVRIYGRADAILKVTWRMEKASTSKESVTTNVSRGGVFIRENQFFPHRGDIVEVVIRHSKNVISGKAIVRWIYSPGSASNDAPGFGVEFLTLTASGEELFLSLGLR